jgi:hypothetical protein
MVADADRPNAGWSHKTFALAALIVAGATIARVYAALGDFWLDEINAWMMIFRLEPVEAWWEILLIRQETNHFLNTWILYLFGPEVPWTFYRLPAVLIGAGAVVMAGLICRRRGSLEALTAMLLVGASYPLIHYSSEARGYSYVVFFSFLSLFLADRALASPRLRWELLFSICAILGMLAQLLYLYCFVSIAAWSVWRMWREGRTWRAIAIKAVRLHSLPVVFTTLLYVVTIRHMKGVGGPILPLGEVIVTTLSLTAGGPLAGVMAFAVALLLCLALIGGLWLLRKERSDWWVFYVSVGCVAPLLLIVVVNRPFVYPRYFLISGAFLLLLLSHALAGLARIERFGRPLYALFVVAFLAGNTIHTIRLIEVGRGAYRDAVLMMEQQTVRPRITIGSDHDYRNGFVLDFYRLQLPLRKDMVYFPLAGWPKKGPEWVLRHSLETDYRAPDTTTDRHGNTYRLVRQFPYAGLSGWHWAVYHNKNSDDL